MPSKPERGSERSMVAPCGSAIPGRRRVSTSTEKSIAPSVAPASGASGPRSHATRSASSQCDRNVARTLRGSPCAVRPPSPSSPWRSWSSHRSPAAVATARSARSADVGPSMDELRAERLLLPDPAVATTTTTAPPPTTTSTTAPPPPPAPPTTTATTAPPPPVVAQAAVPAPPPPPAPNGGDEGRALQLINQERAGRRAGGPADERRGSIGGEGVVRADGELGPGPQPRPERRSRSCGGRRAG